MKWQTSDIAEYSNLKANAKSNRDNMTKAESVFWSFAKSSGLGQKCRRQYIIGRYIVDFFFRKSMLIIELDGGYHSTEQQQDHDSTRQDYLERQGYRILRFTNEEVLQAANNVIEIVKQNL